ncbi:Hypothetical protein NGAL_HAMBI2605_20460 [Neorhizobium galegae bv. orientalis]|uniref:CC0125/CC1285 family lipoprotein n=1 Tax=Neorhizobium galegae TaxID=399 RepID=UPI000621E1EF|nr:hypothetical protein [Neorhizobium galegae]MCQ1770884.1 hypothetical protein [Neorhizobium galegae]MCQ1799590.1 hypothetical protein [Neorhizobium galegae]CDZ62591.1 Hypothetical protein NGAL_HAMBI2605_20460 [Neorhizobium galegae bv. orientalis]
MFRKIAMIVALAGMLAGCQTQYQEMSFTGGVSAMPITGDTYRIVSRGNGYTDATTVQDYSLLKAAETTLSTGNTHFLMLTGNDATRTSVGQTSGYMQTHVYGNTAYSTYTPGMTYNIVKPGQDLIIKLFNTSKGPVPPGAFAAQEVFNNISPRVVRPKKGS